MCNVRIIFLVGLIGNCESGQTCSRHKVSEMREKVLFTFARKEISWEKLA